MPNAASREWRVGRRQSPRPPRPPRPARSSSTGSRRGPGVGDGVLVDAEELVDVLLGHEAGAVGVLGRGASQERRRGPIHPGERLGESARAIAEQDSVDTVLDQLWERTRRRRHRRDAAAIASIATRPKVSSHAEGRQRPIHPRRGRAPPREPDPVVDLGRSLAQASPAASSGPRPAMVKVSRSVGMAVPEAVPTLPSAPACPCLVERPT